ncbi:MAG TPA: hypothetical protein VEY13_03515 [Rubrobacteraceae bacterium]|nr:hypothetical protein [Rubrobacteraceae bacterium]
MVSALYFLSFMVLFLTAGIGNGSTYRMIPTIFRTERVREVEDGGEGAKAEAAGRVRRIAPSCSASPER